MRLYLLPGECLQQGGAGILQQAWDGMGSAINHRIKVINSALSLLLACRRDTLSNASLPILRLPVRHIEHKRNPNSSYCQP